MIQTFQTIYEGTALKRTPQKVRQIAAIAGAIKSVTIEAQNVAIGDFVFNVKKNGTALSSGGGRITINSSNKIVTKSGLNIAVNLGDLISFHIEEVAQTGLLPEIYFIVNIDDGVSSEADIAGLIHAQAAKTSPVNADEFALVDSAASNVLKKLSWQNLKATLKTYFDSLYQALLVSGTNIKTINGNSLLGSGNISISGGGESGSKPSVFSIDAKPFEDAHPLSDFGDNPAISWVPFQPDYSSLINDNGSIKLIVNPQSGDLVTGGVLPLPDGNCTIIAKLNVFYPKGGFGVVLTQDAIANPNTSDIMFFGLFRSDASGGSCNIIAPRLSDYQTFAPPVFADTAYSDSISFVYIRLSRKDTTWTFSYSENGKKWLTVGTFTESSHYKPKEFGLMADNQSTLSDNITGFYSAEMLWFFDRDGATLQGGLTCENRTSSVENRVTCIGDSLTDGFNVGELKTYPHQLADLLDGVSVSYTGRVLTPDDESRIWKVLNKGYSGYTTQDIIGKILPNVILRRDLNLTRDIAVVFAGTNDIANGDSAATVYGRLTTICTTLLSAGYEVYICTLIDRNDLGGGFDAVRASLSTLINANTAGADGVIDLFADARLADASNSTYFQADTIHLKAAGNAVVAELVEVAL